MRCGRQDAADEQPDGEPLCGKGPVAFGEGLRQHVTLAPREAEQPAILALHRAARLRSCRSGQTG